MSSAFTYCLPYVYISVYTCGRESIYFQAPPSWPSRALCLSEPCLRSLPSPRKHVVTTLNYAFPLGKKVSKCNYALIILCIIQSNLEQYRFELHTSTYVPFFFFINTV